MTALGGDPDAHLSVERRPGCVPSNQTDNDSGHSAADADDVVAQMNAIVEQAAFTALQLVEAVESSLEAPTAAHAALWADKAASLLDQANGLADEFHDLQRTLCELRRVIQAARRRPDEQLAAVLAQERLALISGREVSESLLTCYTSMHRLYSAASHAVDSEHTTSAASSLNNRP